MSYAEQAAQAVKDGRVERLTTEMLKFEEGDTLIGKFISRELIASKVKKLPDFYRYYFDTDDGPVNVLFSGAFDNDVGATLKGGSLYQFKHKGVVSISGARQFKQIETLLIAPPMEQEEEDKGLQDDWEQERTPR